MRFGFSLLELLVVTAVITLLAGLLLPVTVRAKGAAHRAVSIQSVKQVGLSQFLYMADFDDAVAMNRDCTLMRDSSTFAPCRVGYGLRGWIDLVRPYVRGYDVFKSPKDPIKAVPLPPYIRHHDGSRLENGLVWSPRPNGEELGGEYRSSYARNNNFANNGTYTAFSSMASSPATLILIYSFAANSGAGANGNEGVPGSSFTIVRRPGVRADASLCVPYSSSAQDHERSSFLDVLPSYARRIEAASPSSERYDGMGVYAFADGHVKSLPPARIKGQCGWGTSRGVETGNDGVNPDFRF